MTRPPSSPSGSIVVHPDPVAVGGTVDIEGFYLPHDAAMSMFIRDASGDVTTPCQTDSLGQVFINGVVCNTLGTSLVEFQAYDKRKLVTYASVEFQVT